MMEHLKDIVNGLMSSIPQQKWEEIQEAKRTKEEDAFVRVLITLEFREMDTLIRFAKQIPVSEIPPSALYKHREIYLLLLDLSDTSEEEVRRLSNLTDEYAARIYVGAERQSFIEEHGNVILRKDAIEKLKEL
jgi:adapter protein MecA 1/2